MQFFDRLKKSAMLEWVGYTEHEFVQLLSEGELSVEAFRQYLVQDYLFLIQFARAFALGAYKSETVEDMRTALEGAKAIVDVEMELHLKFCARWNLDRATIETAREEAATTAYSRFALDTGMGGDLLDLQVALAPCILGYAEIGRRLAAKNPKGDNPYREWIEEYAGEGYQSVAREFAAWMERTASLRLTESRMMKLTEVFRRACVLEGDFWQMGLDRARSSPEEAIHRSRSAMTGT